MEAGEHLIVYHRWYVHHGIDLGDGRVVHFGRGIYDLPNAKVEVVSRQEFADGGTIRKGTSPICFSRNEVVQRAMECVGQGNYDLWDNNCEHFVHWCRNGNRLSLQSHLVQTGARQAIAIITKTWLWRRGLLKSLTPGVVADVVQVAVESACVGLTHRPHWARIVGKLAGSATAAATGWARGGPVGAAVHSGVFLACQSFGAKSVGAIKANACR